MEPLNISPGIYGVASYVARCAQLAMCLEVSASPKPGNIDRNDDYEDTRYEHFLASAISMYPVIAQASMVSHGVGSSIRDAVVESTGWQKGGNTHFGAIILLVPLAMAAGKLLTEKGSFTIPELTRCAHGIVQASNAQDAVDFYSCFSVSGVRVNPVDEYDLQDEGSKTHILGNNVSLYTLMEVACGYDMIANEWVNGFVKCTECAQLIQSGMEGALRPWPDADINDVIVFSFLKLLSLYSDTFIITKHDRETAEQVSGLALDIVHRIEGLRDVHKVFNYDHMLPIISTMIQDMDNKLLQGRINPGSIADIVIAGLFMALLSGVRY